MFRDRTIATLMLLFAASCNKPSTASGGSETSGAGSTGDSTGDTTSGTTDTGGPVCDEEASARLIAVDADLVGGPLAFAKLTTGDVVLENGELRIAIQGPGRDVAVNPYGGTILDADLVLDGEPANRDTLGEIGVLLNIVGTSSADTVEVLADGADCTTAVVRVTGTYMLSDYINPNTVIPGSLPGITLPFLDVPWPLTIQTDYALAPGDRHVTITNTITNDSGSDTVPIAMAYLLDGGLGDPFGPEGFDLPDLGNGDYLRIVDDEIAYALVPMSDAPERLIVAIAGGYALAQDIDLLGVAQFPNIAPDELAPGDSISFEAWFIVGESLSEIEAEARLGLGETECTIVHGLVEEQGSGAPLSGVSVTAIALDQNDSEIGPIANAHSDLDGRLRLCLEPQTTVALIAGVDGRPYAGGGPDPERTIFDVGPFVEFDPMADPNFVLTLPETGALAASIVDGDDLPLPSRVTVLGVDPSPPTILLDGDGFDPLPPGVAHQADSVDGNFEFALEPGDYDVVVTRGPEYSMFRTEVSVGAGQTTMVAGSITRVLDTTGYLSGDFHVHAQVSPDSTVLLEDRVRNCVAENVEVIVSSDQAFLTDYMPTITALGVEAYMTSFIGEEAATPDYGHFNLFPLEEDLSRHSHGSNDWVGVDVPGIVALRQDTPGGTPGIVQINHPRSLPAPGLGNYFTQIDLQFDANGPFVGPMSVETQAVRLPDDAVLLATDFDAMEVMTWVNVQGLSDWFNFLNAGVTFTGVGNSDTHTVHVESSGWPRNFVGVGSDDPETLDPDAFIDAVRAGNSSVSFGPFITLAAREPGGNEVTMGDTLDASNTGDVELVLRLQAADWVEIDQLDVYENGVLIHTEPVMPMLVPVGDEQRYELEFVHATTPSEDAWYVVVATGSASLYPAIVYNKSDPETLTLADIRADAVDAPILPFAATNPVWVDIDGDNVITPSHVVVPDDYMDYRAEYRTTPY